jgi:hypothetical protein
MMPLSEPQQREAAQLLLVARAYLQHSDPPAETRQVLMGAMTASFTGERLTAAEWAHTLRTAHLASAAVRLAAVDELLEETQTGTRNAHSSCRAYFKRDSDSTDDLTTQGGRWFHVLLRDVIGHIEPWVTKDRDDPMQQQRYRDRLRYIGETTLGDAHARLSTTASALAESLTAAGVHVPTIAP